jgi:hypothetical protein
MKTDNPRSAADRFRQKAKGNPRVRRMVDCGDYYLFEGGTKDAPVSYRVMKKNGKVKKVKVASPGAKKRKKAASTAGGILKAVVRKFL